MSATVAAPLQPVELTVRNTGAAPLRCVLVLAHFVTRDLPPLPAGGAVAIALDRDPGTGALSQRRQDGRPMMVENLLCGAADRWDATRGEVPLLPLRAATAGHLATDCRADGRLACTRPAAAEAK